MWHLLGSGGTIPDHGILRDPVAAFPSILGIQNHPFVEYATRDNAVPERVFLIGRDRNPRVGGQKGGAGISDKTVFSWIQRLGGFVRFGFFA